METWSARAIFFSKLWNLGFPLGMIGYAREGFSFSRHSAEGIPGAEKRAWDSGCSIVVVGAIVPAE